MMAMALDVGDVRIGIARTDELGLTAQPLGVRERTNEAEDIAYFCNLVKEWKTEHLVIGLPIKLDGTDSPQTEKVRAFADALDNALHIPITLSDERCTTVAAEEVLRQGGVRTKKRKKGVLDVMAAQIILQDWLSEQQNARARSNTDR